MVDLIRITLKDRLWISRLGLAPTLNIPPIELTTKGQKRIIIVAGSTPVALNNPTTQFEVALVEMFRGPPVASAAIITLTASTMIPGHRAIMLDANGHAALADTSSPTFVFTGISTTGANTGGQVNVAQSGIIEEPTWSFVPLSPVFISTNGLLTQTPPSHGISQIIAVAQTPTSLLILPQTPIILS